MGSLRITSGRFSPVLVPVIALVAAGCASIEREEVAAPPDGGAVTMRAGAPLVVSLAPDPSVGYGWVLTSSSANMYLIGGPDYTPEPKPPGLVGVANTTAYRFRANAPGQATIEFAWQAPPGQAPAPAKTVRYDVTIAPQLPSTLFGIVGPSGADGQPAVKYWFF